MVHNPLRSRAQRKTSAMLTRVGWEPPQTWPVPRPDGAPLVFQTRLPAAEFVAADELPARRRRDAPASVGGAIVPLEEAQRAEHVFLAAAICSTEADHGVLATMTAALAAQATALHGRRRRHDGPAGTQEGQGHGRAGHRGRAPGGRRAGSGGTGSLVVQYAIRQRHGTLTLTFVTHGPGLAGNARRLFQNIVRGCHLGTAPLAAQDAAAQR